MDVDVLGIDWLLLYGKKVLPQLTEATVLCAPEKTLRKRNHQ